VKETTLLPLSKTILKEVFWPLILPCKLFRILLIQEKLDVHFMMFVSVLHKENIEMTTINLAKLQPHKITVAAT
jgi:hypothetical protein